MIYRVGKSIKEIVLYIRIFDLIGHCWIESGNVFLCIKMNIKKCLEMEVVMNSKRIGLVIIALMILVILIYIGKESKIIQFGNKEAEETSTSNVSSIYEESSISKDAIFGQGGKPVLNINEVPVVNQNDKIIVDNVEYKDVKIRLFDNFDNKDVPQSEIRTRDDGDYYLEWTCVIENHSGSSYSACIINDRITCNREEDSDSFEPFWIYENEKYLAGKNADIYLDDNESKSVRVIFQIDKDLYENTWKAIKSTKDIYLFFNPRGANHVYNDALFVKLIDIKNELKGD